MNENAIETIHTLLPKSGNVTTAEIEEAVDKALKIFNNCDRDELIKEVQSLYNIEISNYTILEKEQTPWIEKKKSSIEWNFWNRYKKYLLYNENYPDKVINQLDSLTDKTLDSMFDPKIVNKISKRGMIVGEVQSGKTSNYIGLICKAVDAGFNFIIILAGIHNSLRSQTQLRIDEGFLGFDTQLYRAYNNTRAIGVSHYKKNLIAHSLTSSADDGDFKTNIANNIGINFNTNDPIIAVVKKNSTVLKKLKQWLRTNATNLEGKKTIRNKSLLLIDDEADNASININIGDNASATKINSLIRDILNLFEKNSYVGYTATPFANIFIPVNNDDLFPKDFIINLPVPSNYIGPEKIFGFEFSEDNENDNLLPSIVRIDDYIDFCPPYHKKDDSLPEKAPDSLRLAIRCFIITCAVRILRGQSDNHNSMLVHVTRFIRWQNKIKEIVENVLNYYKCGIKNKIPVIIVEFKETFDTDRNNYKSYKTISDSILKSELIDLDTDIKVHKWEDVEKYLYEAASRIKVMELNGGSDDVLNYKDYYNEYKSGLNVIAVGGNKLSRGLTLEGLSISYFLRASHMYDTLMQMGRWFGYKRGYVDLCRLFLSEELNEWFCHISLASKELKDEFDYMANVEHEMPERYALKVRTHQGVLQITASNKIWNTNEIRISWSGSLSESYELSKSGDIIRNNLERTIELINNLGDNFEKHTSSYLWKNIDSEIIKEWISGFKVHENLKSASGPNLYNFIHSKNNNGNLLKWNVGLITKKEGNSFKINDNININMIFRRQDEKSTPDTYLIRRAHIISPNDEFIDLSEDEYEKAMNETNILWKKKGKAGTPHYLNGNLVRNQIRFPDKVLLLLYFLDPEGAELEDKSFPIIGYAISFPGNKTDDSVSYAINNQLLPYFQREEEFKDEEEDNDEE